MKLRMAATYAAMVLLASWLPAVRAFAQPAAPFPQVPIESRARSSYIGAYASLAAGAGLIGLSFAFSHRADRTYDDYLSATDPALISKLYDRTVRYDRFSSSALITGEILVGTGLYLRFLRRPASTRLNLSLAPERCTVAWRF